MTAPNRRIHHIPARAFGRFLGAAALCGIASLTALAAGGKGTAATACAPAVNDSMQPIAVSGVKIKNFGVVDGHIYRGTQPCSSDYAGLRSLGVDTVVDLRDDAKDSSRRDAEAAGLRYVNIPMDDGDRPYDEQIAAFLRVVTSADNGKCFVHCAGGRHRTGATIAIYRIAVQGWTPDAAFAEMESYDFYSRWGHGGYKKYVYDYYRRMQSDPASVPLAYVPGRAAVISAPE